MVGSILFLGLSGDASAPEQLLVGLVSEKPQVAVLPPALHDAELPLGGLPTEDRPQSSALVVPCDAGCLPNLFSLSAPVG